MSASRVLARTVAVAGMSIGLVVPALGSATADPRTEDGAFPLTCNGVTYQVVTAGNGEWTPAHDANSNLVFIPHSFGVFHGEVRDADGNLVDSFDEPAATQGSGKQKNDVTCTYSFSEVSDGSDPEFPAGYSFSGSGPVTGQIAGHA
jgi:hypothetical protein